MQYNKENKLIRKNISLTQRQNIFLIEESKLCQTSESDILRRVLDEKINNKITQITTVSKVEGEKDGKKI